MVHNQEKQVNAIILTAGNSSRMQSPKAFLTFDEEVNTNFLEKIIQEFTDFGCKKIVVVYNDQVKEFQNFITSNKNNTIVFVKNSQTSLGRFYSLKLGLNATDKKTPCFIHNIDNPFLNQSILDLVYSKHLKADYISPEFKGRCGHPSLLSAKVSGKLSNETMNGFILNEYLRQFDRLKVPVQSKDILIDIDTPLEYSKLFKKETAQF